MWNYNIDIQTPEDFIESFKIQWKLKN
jgi:hypothetical protein